MHSQHCLEIPREAGVFSLRSCRHGTMAFLRADVVIGRALDVCGEFAESTNRILGCLVEEGDIAIDVGANVGTVTLALAAKAGPRGHIVAFEPQRLIHQALCANLTINGCSHVSALRAAVGRSSGTARIAALDATVAQNFGGVALNADAGSEKVPLVALDDLDVPRCAVIKIDAEGMDYDVLVGAAATIDRTRPALYFEAHDQPVASEAFTFLSARDYRCYWHFACFLGTKPFRGDNTAFGVRGDINALAVPIESAVKVALPDVSAPGADWKRDYARFLTSGSPSEMTGIGLTEDEYACFNELRARIDQSTSAS